MAHVGTGSFSIELLSSLDKSWDSYSGRKVVPKLSFIERNTISGDASVGTHRHEANQEMWFIEKGEIVVEHGIAGRNSSNYIVSRQWSSNGEKKDTTQFDASGGWIESRTLKAGDFTVIVPNSENKNEVTFNGFKSVWNVDDEVIFWTLGTKN